MAKTTPPAGAPKKRKAPAATAQVRPADAAAEDDLVESMLPMFAGEDLDRRVNATLSKLTLGISPASLMEAWADWLIHLETSPGKQQQLFEKAGRKVSRYLAYCGRTWLDAECPSCIEPLPHDKRFAGDAWQRWPFRYLYQSFLLTQQWWHNATTGVRGVSKHHEQVVSFVARQLLDMAAPSNFPLTNPEILEATIRQGGGNLYRGALNFMEDWERAVGGKPPVGADDFQVGRDVAATPGKVVFRNRLIELIQYSPTTAEVRREPILIVPAWIMKYYILDLSPGNSLIKYLVDHGHTVFAISWKNPGEEERDLGMEDYRREGIMAAVDAVSSICPETRINALGYCLGGTLLTVAAATMGRDRDDRLASVTLLAAETDFTEAGELMLFIDESQVTYLEDMMWERGYLDTRQMAGAFQLLRSNDLIWSRMVHDYLLGQRAPMIDLMAWNADATRMPYRMHSEYLRRLFLNNDLAEGRYVADGRSIAITDIRVPMFAVGTVRDHVAPWHSVYKINLLTDTDVTFLLTTGGHNAGIVSPPGHPHRSYQIATKREGDPYKSPEAWQASAPHHEGSWWPAWTAWVDRHAEGGKVKPPKTGNAAKGYRVLCDAPGTYVMET